MVMGRSPGNFDFIQDLSYTYPACHTNQKSGIHNCQGRSDKGGHSCALIDTHHSMVPHETSLPCHLSYIKKIFKGEKVLCMILLEIT